MRWLGIGLVAMATPVLLGIADAAPAPKTPKPPPPVPVPVPAPAPATPAPAAPATPKAPAPPKTPPKPDTVTKKDGTQLSGKITKVEAQSITGDFGGKVLTLKNDEFSSFQFGDLHPSYWEAEGAMGGGNFDRAAASYMTALKDSPRAELHKPLLLMALAKAQLNGGRASDAQSTLRKLRSECGDCRQRVDSLRLSLQISRDSKEDLSSILQEMLKEPEPMKSEAEFELAKLQYAKKDFAAAQTAFSRIALSISPAASEAKAWNLRCLRALKKTSELETASKSALSDKSVSPALVQVAGASLAEILLAKSPTDKGAMREIYILCSQAIAAGPPAKEDSPEDYASALVNGATALATLSREATKKELQAEYRTLAIMYLQEVDKYYKDTEWAKSAKEQLTRLGGAEKQPKEAPKKDAPKDAPKGAK